MVLVKRNIAPGVGRLRSLRIDREMSLAEVAERIGITPSGLSQIEHGSRRPSVDVARALFDLYGGEISLGEIHDPTHPQYVRDTEGQTDG